MTTDLRTFALEHHARHVIEQAAADQIRAINRADQETSRCWQITDALRTAITDIVWGWLLAARVMEADRDLNEAVSEAVEDDPTTPLALTLVAPGRWSATARFHVAGAPVLVTAHFVATPERADGTIEYSRAAAGGVAVVSDHPDTTGEPIRSWRDLAAAITHAVRADAAAADTPT